MTTSPTTDQPELLPCPFCGSDELSHGWSEPGYTADCQGIVQCHSCDAYMLGGHEIDAITAWNTRPTFTTPTLGDMEETVAKAIYDATHAGLSNCYAWDDAWEDHQEARRDRYYKEARAAIKAMLSAAAASPIPISVANEGASMDALATAKARLSIATVKARNRGDERGIVAVNADDLAILIAAYSDAAPASPTPTSVNEAGEREWPDIGVDPLKASRPDDRYEAARLAVREAYVMQQPHVPDQTALVWRWHIGTLLEMALRLQCLLRREPDPAPALSPALDNTAVEGQEAISDAVHSALWTADAENKRLREALQPFANAADRLTHYGDINDHYEGTNHRLFASRTGSHLLELLDGVDGDPLTIGHLTEARAALTAETEKAR